MSTNKDCCSQKADMVLPRGWGAGVYCAVFTSYDRQYCAKYKENFNCVKC